MKKIFQIIGLTTLIIFSFFYTDKVLEVVREEDKIMIKLESIKETAEKKPIDAKIVKDTIIPGITGRTINVEKSYKKMKNTGIFNQKEIVYDIIKPNISIINNKDKYITSGNPNNQKVSIIFILNSNKYLNNIEKIIDNKGIVVNYFINYQYLINNTTKIKEITNKEFYSYGENGKYTPDSLLFSNNLISRISNNNANICLTKEKNNEILNLCSKNDLYTILPNIIRTEKPYKQVKENLTSGSIILLNINQDTLTEISLVIDYINGKGLNIVGLNELITE